MAGGLRRPKHALYQHGLGRLSVLPTGPANHQQSQFTGWMLLSYGRLVQSFSTLAGHMPNLAVDESIKLYWSAATANPGEYFRTDG